MADEELTISAKNEEFIRKMTECQKVIQATKKAMDDLYETGKKGFSDISKVDEYTKNMEALKKTLSTVKKEQEELVKTEKDYGTAGEQANQKIEKSGNTLTKSMKSWAAGFVTVTAAVKVFKAIIESTDSLSTKFARTLNGWKEGFSAMARAIANNDFKDFFENVRAAVKEGQRYADTQEKNEDAERAIKIRIAERETALINLRVVQQDATKTEKERLNAGLEAEKILADNAADRLKLAEMQLDNDITSAAFVAKTSKELVKAYLDQDEALLKNIETGKIYNQLQVDLAGTVSNVTSGTAGGVTVDRKAAKVIEDKIKALGSEAKEYGKLAVGLESILDPLKDKIAADYEQIESAKQSAINLRVMTRVNSEEAKAQKKIDSEVTKSKEEFYKKLEVLNEQYNKSVIESLTGEDKLEAIRDFELKQLNVLKDELSALGELTPEMQKQIETLAVNIHKEFSDAMIKVGSLSPTEKEAVSNALISNLPTLSQLQKSYIKTSDADEFEFNLWDKLGFGEEDIKNLKEALGNAFGEVSDALNSYFDKEVDNAERHRELLDTRVSETQQALDDEIELYKAGYASNVTAKKQELVELKKARDAAIVDEEKAMKRQLILESALQAASLASAVANLFSKETKKLGLAGVITAGIGVAAMLISFAASIAKIRSAASSTQLAEGGSGSETGIVTGNRHSGGGERFLDHVEVERGEQWGVLSRPASEKYGKVFHEMVSSFNKDQMPQFMPVSNNVRVENSGPNSRLDKVITEQKKLNEGILKQSYISQIGNKRVIKSGNKIRIIG